MAPRRRHCARRSPRPSRSARSQSSFWDGTDLPATNGGRSDLQAHDRRGALGHILRAPGQLGVGRAYVTGGVEVDDIDAALALLDGWQPPPIDARGRLRLAAAAIRAGALRAIPRAPAAELRPSGRRHSYARDRRAVRHHYDVSNEFFALFLDESMTYSCAIFSRGATSLEEAQEAKLELVCTKLALAPGRARARRRVWLGQLCDPRRPAARRPRHRHHAVGAAGRTRPRARRRRRRFPDRIDIRVADYRDPLERESFDAVASIGMVEHVGSANIDSYARRLAGALRPGGRLLNHGIARLRHTDGEAGPFSERFVFPDAAPLHLSRIQAALERAGLETEHVEGLRPGLRGHAPSLAANGSRAGATTRCDWPALSACGSGASTCGPPGAASRRDSCRSIRCSPAAQIPELRHTMPA